jgi:TatD DNase family protein
MHISEYFNYNFLFDSHCHLNEQGYDKDRSTLVSEAIKDKVEMILDVAVDLETSGKSIEISKEFKGKVKSWIGLDPELFIPGSSIFKVENSNLSKNSLKFFQDEQKKLYDNNTDYIVGIGECGLDYYWLNSRLEKNEIPENTVSISKDFQIEIFTLQLELAEELHLPLSIHSRGAEEECLAIIKNFSGTSGIFHSYGGNYETAKNILDAGWGLGVNGIVTFKNAHEIRDLYKKLLGKVSNDLSPIDFYSKGIFFETDGPFLAPQTKRGERNEPANVRYIYDFFCNFLGNVA